MHTIVIVGSSGTGKSASFFPSEKLGIEGLDPKQTLLINVAGSSKFPAMKNWSQHYKPSLKEGGNYVVSSDYNVLTKAIQYTVANRKEIKYFVIDDAQYLMAYEFMSKSQESGYNKFAVIGANLMNFIRFLNSIEDPNLYCILTWHPEVNTDSITHETLKMKTAGKMVDTYITLEGLFTTVFYSTVLKTKDGVKYVFVTSNDGKYPAKTAPEMFDEVYIPNDMAYVINKFQEYN